jgi:hypothetical protein
LKFEWASIMAKAPWNLLQLCVKGHAKYSKFTKPA